MQIHPEQLIIFTSVVELGSFSAAARHLKKVPSTISMSIANLESSLNLTLFHRTGQKTIPTQAAEALYETAKQLIVDHNQWRQQALSLSQGVESSLTLVIVSELLHTDWEIYIEVLSQQFPLLKLNIFSAPQEDAEEMLMKQTAQLALMFERENLAFNEQFIELKNEILVPMVSTSHPLSQQSHVRFDQLSQYRQIVVTGRNLHKKPLLLYSKHYWRTDNHYSACNLVLQHLGWSMLPLKMLDENPKLKASLAIIDVIDFTPQFRYSVDLVWNKESAMGVAAQFLINYIRTQRLNKD